MPIWILFILLPVWIAIYLWIRHYSRSVTASPPPERYPLLEVIYDGVAIARLTNPKYADMFWESYDITPLSDEGRKLIENNELWDSCKFYFRNPATGKECKGAFAAGPQFVNEGKVVLRGLHAWTTPSA